MMNLKGSIISAALAMLAVPMSAAVLTDEPETGKSLKVRIELVGDYEERLPSCYWQRTCGSSYEPAPGAYNQQRSYAPERNWRREPLPEKRYDGRSPGAYRPQYEWQ